jgi:hypothetical protein
MKIRILPPPLSRRQRGFLLNPYRFAGSIQQGAFSADGAGNLAALGAAIATGALSADGIGALLADSSISFGSFSMTGAGAASFAGASVATADFSSVGVGSLLAVSEPGGLIVDAADFDGVNDFLARTSAFAPNAADSKKGILSFWFKPDAGTPILIDSTSVATGFGPYIQADWNLSAVNKFTIATNGRVAAAVSLNLVTTTAHAAGSWYHVLCSWDMATAGARHLYINDVSDITVLNFNNTVVEYSEVDKYQIGDIIGGGFKTDGGVAEMYFAPGQYLDFSVASNRRKFITSGGKPANLGAIGDAPTGVAPLWYLHLDDGETANNFATNRPGNGNFTVTGALTTYASSPSD